MSAVFLSHFLDESSPGFGGESSFRFEATAGIAGGKSSNSGWIKMFNHMGTHVDVPFHFDNSGKKLSDYPASHWHFQNVTLLDLKVAPDEIIRLENREEQIPADCDLLLLRTGFEKFRHEERYWKNNPGLSEESAGFLKANRPRIRAVGFDFISLTAFQHRELGRRAHREFLQSHNGAPVCIIEDMKLSGWSGPFKNVTVSPLQINEADGAPVTVLAFN